MGILQNNKFGSSIQKLRNADWSLNLLLSYIFSIPFVSAFSFTGTISIPLVLGVVLFLQMITKILRSGTLPADFVGFDIVLLFFFLFVILFSFLVNGWGNSKSMNHTIAYLSTFLLFYIGVKFTLFSIGNKNKVFKRVLQFVTYVTCISAIFANVEFISANFLNLDLNEYIPRGKEEEEFYNPTTIELFVRARAFATESGHFTFMMELFTPLVIYYLCFSGYCKWHSLVKIIVVLIIFFSFVFAASSASFVIIPLALLIAALVHIKSIFLYVRKYPGKFIVASAVPLLLLMLFNYFFSLSSLILLSVVDKLDSGSAYDRQDRIDFFFDKFSHFNPINKVVGIGPAGFSNLGFDDSKSILSLYYSITFEAGFLGVLLMLSFVIYILGNALKIKKSIGFFLLVSIISGIIHYYFIANYWYPWFWFIAAFSVFCNKRFLHE
jgi:hypothetical protein